MSFVLILDQNLKIWLKRWRRYEEISIGRLTVLSQHDSKLRRRKMERGKPRRRPRRRRYQTWIETAVWLRGNLMNVTARFKTGAEQKKGERDRYDEDEDGARPDTENHGGKNAKHAFARHLIGCPNRRGVHGAWSVTVT